MVVAVIKINTNGMQNFFIKKFKCEDVVVGFYRK